MSSKNVYDISTTSIVKVIVILLGLAFVWLIRDVLGLVFVAIILSAAFDPAVDWMSDKLKFPRGLSIISIFVVILGVLATVIFLVSGPIYTEIEALVTTFPQYYENLVSAWNQFSTSNGGQELDIRQSLQGFQLEQATTSLLGFVSKLFGSIFAFFLVLVMTFYLTIEEENMRRFIKSLAPSNYQPYLMQLMTKIQRRLGLWLRGWLVLSVIIFVFVYTALSLLGVKYALVLALLAGAFEIIPFLGPILAAIPAIFLSFQQSPGLAVAVLVVYVIIQQVENNLIVPKIMGRATGLNPIIVLVSILIGAKVGGIVGALLAVPVATAISVWLADFGVQTEKIVDK